MDVKVDYYESERIVIDRFLKLSINGLDEYEVNLKNLSKGVTFYLGECNDYKFDYMPIFVNDSKYYLFRKNEKLYITKNLNKIYRRKSKLFSIITRESVIFFGLFSDISKRRCNCDNIYLNDKVISKIKRPFNFWKFRHFAIIKINKNDILNSGEIHNSVGIGDANGNYTLIKLKKRHKGINYYSRKKIGDNYFLVRSVINSGNVRIVNIKMQPEYLFFNLLKNNIACFLSKIVGKKNIVLLFEKETSKANESGYYVFEKIMEEKNLKSDVYFVIDRNCSDYLKVKNKYPNNVVKKYTFKHYLYIYISKYFVSSELSNHVINPRLYIRNINKEISKKPLVFLQHGIMFAKPVDNPAAAGFRKDNKSINYFKSVICSDLEATQFYKCGFTDDDLIKCGLPKFDVSFQNKNADKIMVMLTYRYWEEAMIVNDETIMDTTYFKSYMAIINIFKENNLLDKLIISCHPKFADCLIKATPEYSKNIEQDINAGLENAKVFITDYSSASYDAHYRGAYIIYYWAEKEYLIENYQAIPPIDETNCDGVPVYSVDELIVEVKNAIKKKYRMEKKYEERYKKINEFHDGKNGDRLVEELKKLNII